MPFWPLGLPKWHDWWIAQGLYVPGTGRCYVAVWGRGGNEKSCKLKIELLRGTKGVHVQKMYPSGLPAETEELEHHGVLKVTLLMTTCAGLFVLRT